MPIKIIFTGANSAKKQLTISYALDDQKNSVSTGDNQWVLYARLLIIYVYI